MRWGTLWIGVGRGFCVALLTSGLAASSSAGREDLEEVAVEPPPGFIRFCLEFADQCQTPPNGPSSISLTKEKLELIQKINREVNKAIWPEDDQEHYGRAEYWTIPTDGYGDCEDYALTKRKWLIDTGFPARALRLAIVLGTAVGRHAVLIADTSQGDLVLDNLADEVTRRTDSVYQWIEEQDKNSLRAWVASTPLPTAVVVATTVATK